MVRSRLVAALPFLLSSIVLGDSRQARDCSPSEGPEYFEGRYQWYVATYGRDGAFDPERRLADVREAYLEYRRDLTARKRRPAAEPLDVGAFRFLGPANGAGRMPAVELHPSSPDIVYGGAAGGGCWKSTDRGLTWRSLTDGLSDLSVGAVALAPSDPSIVYLGTGEGGYGGGFIPGIGILRSSDGGETWQLPDSVLAPLVYRLSVDPRDPRTVLAFVNGGAYRSTDGARTWARTSAASWGDGTDVARDAGNPDVLHATFWVSGQTSRYAKSTDAGRTWIEKTAGLPGNPKSRTSVAISSNGATVYLMIASAADNSLLGVYRSTNAGESFANVPLLDSSGKMPNILSLQGWYDNCLAVDADDERVLILGGGGAGHFRTTNGGSTVAQTGVTDGVHVDAHQLVSKRYGSLKVTWTANDGGLWLSTDGGVRWSDRNAGLATRQYYSVALDPTRPDVMLAGSQDNGTDRKGDGTTTFTRVIGGDGFEAAVNPDRPTVVYGSSQFTTLFRSKQDGRAGTFSYIAQPVAGQAYSGSSGDAPKPFTTWLTLDPTDPRVVYTGTWRVWRSEDSGDTWAPLGSDVFSSATATQALSISRARPDRLLVAQSNGVYLSDDRGETFRKLGVSAAGSIRNVEIDPRNADVMYVCSTASATSSTRGSLYRSTDGGESWSRRDAGLPNFGIETVRVDPADSRTLYAGTLVGLFRSTNQGETWARFGDGLPAAAVHEVRLPPDGSRIVVATHGRGIWSAAARAANQPPAVRIDTPSASEVSVPLGGSLSLTGSAIDPENEVVSLRWDLGDGRTVQGAATGPVSFRRPGIYSISLVGEDARGGRGAAILTVTVAPPNDRCDDATPLSLIPGAPVVVRTANGGAADLDAADPVTCSDPAISSSIWFRFTAPAAGTLDLDTLASSGDTVLALYEGTCGSLRPVGCNDDGPDVSGGGSKLETAALTAGKEYRVLVASWADPSRGYTGPVEAVQLRALFKSGGTPVPAPTAVLPSVLDVYGKDGVHFVSDQTLLNRGSSPLTVALAWGGNAGAERVTSVLIPAGGQLRAESALEELRQSGIAVPRATPTSPQIGSLAATVTSGDAGALGLAARTTSPAPGGGSFGLFAQGTRFDETASDDTVEVFGLRQTDRDRSNLALVHVPTPGVTSEIELEVEVRDATGAVAPGSPLLVTLARGAFTQLNEVLKLAGLPAGSPNGGYVRVRRTKGSGRFLAYGVVNDQKTADGSLVPMTRRGGLDSPALVIPVVLEAAGQGGSFFTSELVLANRTDRAITASLRYVAAPVFGGAGSGRWRDISLAARGQLVIPELLKALRQSGLAIPEGSAQGGMLIVEFSPDDLTRNDVYAGVRTTTPGPAGGTFGVFTPGVAPAELATTSATVMALRKDATVRSNLGLVNAGKAAITLVLSLRSPADGKPIGTEITKRLEAGEWTQVNDVLEAAGVGEGEAWAQITRTAGDDWWWAYGVLNDALTSDGSVIGALVPR